MTTVAAMICADGLVMGSDTKVVSEGSGIKWSANKLTTAMLGDSPLVIGCAGRAKKGVNLGVSRVQFHEILNRASHPIKRPQSDSEQP